MKSGDGAREIERAKQERKKRADHVRKLKAERVDEKHTRAELEALHRQLKADFYRRNPS
jgi:hypothetical protein